MIEPRTLEKLEHLLTEGGETVLLPVDLLASLLEAARQVEQTTPAFTVGDTVRVDPRHCAVVGACGVVVTVWPGAEPVYEVLLQYGRGSRLLYRESELHPEAEHGR
jgi:D-serine deaminase-like pyridoxal phosphate-dependent protein